jgi:phosphatidate cytidylyltransferase
MTRLLSGIVLIALVVAGVWLASDDVLQVAGLVTVVMGAKELVALARASGLEVSMWPVTTAALLAFATVAGTVSVSGHTEVALMIALVGLGLVSLDLWQGGPTALASVSASLFPAIYLGLPLGALVAIRRLNGPAGLFLLMLTVMVSDTAQYYTGRLLGRRPLAPTVSPRKTMEGAAGGFVFGTALFIVAGAWWLPSMSLPLRGGLGASIVALGIAGDLFESMLKRSAGVKDSSALIPGHGGVLDRIDALLFAAPVYYIVLRYV